MNRLKNVFHHNFKMTNGYIAIALLAIFASTGCSPMMTSKEYANKWVGLSVDRLEYFYKVKHPEKEELNSKVGEEYKQNTQFFRAFEHHHPPGVCYTDFIIDSKSQIIVGYKIYGDEGACDY